MLNERQDASKGYERVPEHGGRGDMKERERAEQVIATSRSRRRASGADNLARILFPALPGAKVLFFF